MIGFEPAVEAEEDEGEGERDGEEADEGVGEDPEVELEEEEGGLEEEELHQLRSPARRGPSASSWEAKRRRMPGSLRVVSRSAWQEKPPPLLPAMTNRRAPLAWAWVRT